MRAETKLVLNSGLFAGLLGYATIVVFFVLLNLLVGRSIFYTAALFGSAMFYGLEDPAQLVVAPGPVLSFNMVHLLTFLAVGFVTSWLVEEAEEHPAARYVILVALIFIAAHLYAALLLFAQPLMASSAWWQIGIASLAAAAAMGWYLLRLHPRLRRELREIPMGEEA